MHRIDAVCLWEQVWNEPNDQFWQGSQAEYWELYGHAARAIKKASPKLQVGGPATCCVDVSTQASAACHATATIRAAAVCPDTPRRVRACGQCWIKDFVSMCRSTSTPFDFVSTHDCNPQAQPALPTWLGSG